MIHKLLLSDKYWRSIFMLVRIAIQRQNSNTFLGGIWGIIQPFLHITVIAYFMSFILRFDPKTILSNLVGALPFWTFLISGMTIASGSLVNRADILKRVLLPKSYFPISDILNILF